MKTIRGCILLCFWVLLACQSVASSCGKRRVKRVVGGVDAMPHTWPWQALLQFYKDGKWEHKCGGTLISERWVLTAAHCLFMTPRPSFYRVKLGAHYRSRDEKITQTFSVDKLVIHRRFLTDKRYGYDIALIKLSRPAILNFAVGLACLPQQGQSIPVGSQCYLTGWGFTSFGGQKATVLQQVMLPIASYEDCQKGNSWFHPIHNTTMLCAGFGGNSTKSGCNGDSGGPLVCEENSRWVVHGAVSWGDLKCRAKSTYAVFTRISSFINWINQKMSPRYHPAYQMHRQGICSDNHRYCSTWKRNGFCNHKYYRIMLQRYCARTCGHCICSDNHRYCSTWERNGFCNHKYYRIMLQRYCARTCGHC